MGFVVEQSGCHQRHSHSQYNDAGVVAGGDEICPCHDFYGPYHIQVSHNTKKVLSLEWSRYMRYRKTIVDGVYVSWLRGARVANGLVRFSKQNRNLPN